MLDKLPWKRNKNNHAEELHREIDNSRHVAAASITKQTKSIAVVVSESSVVRIFDGGEIVTEILPELWLLNRHGVHINAPFTTQKIENIAVACIKE